MIGILAKTFSLATGQTPQSRSHWAPGTRFDNRKAAEMEAHLVARRRD